MGQMLETYRGEALAWEADELGHMNMRYYFARSGQARTFFFAHLHLAYAYKAQAFSTVIVQNHYIKYIKELRPGQGMIVETGVIEIGETDLKLIHVISGVGSGVAATIIEHVSHISRRTQKPFPWPERVRRAAAAYAVELPAQAAPRNIDPLEPLTNPSMKAADALDLPIIGRGAFQPDECDAFGFVRPFDLIGRTSDSVQHLTAAWPDLDYISADAMSGALLEARIIHRNRPKAGDCFVFRSGLRSINTHTREFCHWILDPVSGKCWASFVGVACRFNMDTRRLVKISDKELAKISKNIIKGLQP
jgi:acyl-CoA thioester hydrolase